MKLLLHHVFPFGIISTGSHTSLSVNLSFLEATPEVILWECFNQLRTLHVTDWNFDVYSVTSFYKEWSRHVKIPFTKIYYVTRRQRDGAWCITRQSWKAVVTVTLYTVEAAYYNRGCYQSAIVIKIGGSKTRHLKSIKNNPFIIINLSVIVIKLQIIRVRI